MANVDTKGWFTNITTNVDELAWHFSTFLAPLCSILLVCALAANLLIIVAIVKYPKLRTNFNFYLLSIAVTDVLYLIAAMAIYFPCMYYGHFAYGLPGCLFWLYSDWTFRAAAENLMMLVSLDRFVCVFYPVFYRSHQSERYSLILIICVGCWLHCLVLPSLLLAGLDPSLSLEKSFCGIDYRNYRGVVMACVLFIYWVPEIVTVAAYCAIAVKMNHKKPAGQLDYGMRMENGTRGVSVSQKMLRQTTSPTNETNGTSPPEKGSTEALDDKPSKGRRAKDTKAFKLLSYLVVSVFICCIPADIYHVVNVFKPEWATYTFYQVTIFVTFFHCFLTPILYHAGSEDMRKAVKALKPKFCTT